MTTNRNKQLTLWNTEKWTGDRKLPGGYIVTNVFDSNGAAEIVAWAPQRDRAEQIARIPELELLASIGERLAMALKTASAERSSGTVRRLVHEFDQIKAKCPSPADRKSVTAA